MKRRMLGLSAGLLLLGLLPGTAAAVSTVDQSNEVKTGAGSGGLMGQTFTVGRAGLLTGVDLRLGGVAANVEVYLETQVRTTGLPTDVKLATADGSAPSTEQWVHFQFATPVAVLVGSRLAIVTNIDLPLTAAYSDETYAGGTGVIHVATGWVSESWDLDFRTYVDSAAPTAAPTLPPTKAPTKAPTVAPTDTPTPPAPESSASGPATPTPGTSTGPSASPVSSPDASAGPLADPQSGGSGGLPVPIVVALILAVGMAVGGLGFAVGRRPRASA